MKPSHQYSIKSLKRYALFAGVASILVIGFGVISICLYFNPELVWIKPESVTDYQGKTPWLIIGFVFIIFGLVFKFISWKWPRHLLRVLNTQTPKPMHLKFEVENSSNSTEYYACLFDKSINDNHDTWRIRLWNPPRDIHKLVGVETSVMAYRDPETHQPLVMEYDNGYLWAMKGGSNRAWVYCKGGFC